MINPKKIKEIKKGLHSLEEQCKSIGMENETIDALFEGVEIKDCPYCYTPNLVYVIESKKEKFDMYMCNKCNKIYMKRWDENSFD